MSELIFCFRGTLLAAALHLLAGHGKGGRAVAVAFVVWAALTAGGGCDTATNECGGDVLLTHRVGDFCSTRAEGCPFGTVECAGRNQVICSQNCTLTAEHILDAVSLAKKPRCQNGGYYEDFRATECTCPYAFSGPQCQQSDPCAQMECGPNGECEDGRCVCDFMFSGRHCEMRADCQPPQFAWTGARCVCRPGFEGDRCDRCSAGLICVPVFESPHEFEAVVLDDPLLAEEVMTRQRPAGYHAQPYRPSAYAPQLCQCGSALSLGGQSVSSFSAEASRPRAEYDSYVHRMYRESCHSEGGVWKWLVFALAGAVLVLVLLYIYCRHADLAPLPANPSSAGAVSPGYPKPSLGDYSMLMPRTPYR